MITTDNHNSVIKTFTKRVFVIISASAVSIWILISYFSYSDFSIHSKKIEHEYIQSQKKLLQQEVESVERIITYNRSKLDKTIRDNIKERVYTAHSIATHLYEKYKKTKPKKEIINIIKEALRPLRFFDGRGYLFINNLNGEGVLNPVATQFEGADVTKIKNKNGVYIGRNINKLAKEKGEGYYTYDWTKPNETGQFTKVSFVKHFKPYNWAIGTGDYLIEVERNIKKEVLERIGEIQFGKEGYIFVVNYDGYVMMNRGNRSLIGKNILNVTDSNGIRVAEEVIKLAQTPGWDGYFNYTWKKLSSSKVSPKVAYHKMVQDWGWYYGTGIYLDDVQHIVKKQKDKLKSHLQFNLFLIAFTVFIALTIIFKLAQKNTKQLNSDLDQLLGFFSDLTTKSKPLNSDNLTFTEFKQLSNSANTMLQNQKNSAEQNIKFEKQLQQSQKMDAVSQMVGGIAHDFNNLLGVIIGFGQLLESKLTDQPKLVQFCQQINSASIRGAKLTRKLLSLTHAKNAESEKCNINKLLSEEKSFLNKSLTAKINLVLNLKEDIWPVWIVQDDFKDVVLNVCVNAMHAMKEGQQDSHIIISTNNIHIDENSINTAKLAHGNYIELTIADNGIGMSEEISSRIFEPFYTTRDTGTGLGLSQAYSFAQRSDGAVFVHSTLGEGTTFEFLIPRYDKTLHDDNTSTKIPLDFQEENTNLKGTETILIVDDEQGLRDLSKEILSSNGYKVLEAENGVDALVVLETETVNLVLSDVIMPNMDGNLLAKKIKKEDVQNSV